MKNRDRALRKIERCLALSQSANEHEAAAAMRQAKKMMEKYRIEFSELGLSEIDIAEDERITSKRMPVAWKRMLNRTVADAFECSIFYRGGRGRPIFVGNSPAPKIALYAIETLERQIDWGKKEFMTNLAQNFDFEIPRSKKIELGKGFCEGWVVGCRSKVIEFATPITEESHQQHLKKAEQHYKAQTREIKKLPKSAMDGELGKEAAKAGYQGGINAQLHHGMGSDNNHQHRIGYSE